jgi:hypothetical protein
MKLALAVVTMSGCLGFLKRATCFLGAFLDKGIASVWVESVLKQKGAAHGHQIIREKFDAGARERAG